MMGDEYTNNGVNNGHMGPAYYGKKPFELNSGHVDAILSKVDRSLPVDFDFLGPETHQLGTKLVGYMKSLGYIIGAVKLVGQRTMTSNAPEAPRQVEPIRVLANSDRTSVFLDSTA